MTIDNKPDYFFIINENGIIEKLGKDLNVRNMIKFPMVRSVYSSIDVDQDGNNELILQTKGFG